jgi:hypothetical protein
MSISLFGSVRLVGSFESREWQSTAYFVVTVLSAWLALPNSPASKFLTGDPVPEGGG